jgi:ketol-acid reductoisomerase
MENNGDSHQRGAAASALAGQAVAIIGYGDEAREQARRLRAARWDVGVALRPGGMSWIRAVADGFRPVLVSQALAHADVIVVHMPESEQPAMWASTIAPRVAPGTLVVFAHGAALYAGALEPDSRLDVVLVARNASGAGCRVAVHLDATGRALERAAAFARTAFGDARVGTTTVESEVQTELRALVDRKGGVEKFLAEIDRLLANPSHEPDEAALRYYEGLRAALVGRRGAA